VHPTLLSVLRVVTGASTLVAALTLLFGNAENLSWRLLLCCAALLMSALLCGACAPALRSRRLLPVARLGVVFAILAGLGTVVLVVVQFRAETPIRVVVALYLLAALAAHLSALWMVQLAPRGEWARRGAAVAGAAWTSLLVYAAFKESLPGWELWRWTWMAQILMVGFDVLVWLSVRLRVAAPSTLSPASGAPASLVPPDPHGPGTGPCPTCGAPGWAPAAPPPAV
jgi:hypothetical protein